MPLVAISLAILVSFASYAQTKTTIYGSSYVVDTLQCSKVGPGVKFTSLKFTGETTNMVFRTFFLHVDVDNNPNLSARCELANDSIIGVETVRSHAEKRSKPGSYYIAGVNGDFYTTQKPVGIPIYACNQNGKMATPPNGYTPVFAITDALTPWCTPLQQHTSMKVNGGSDIVINGVNNTLYTNELRLFNDLQGKYTHTAAGCKEIALELVEGEKWLINSTMKMRVKGESSTSGNMAIVPNQAVLSADGTAIAVIDALKDGDIIELNLNQPLVDAGSITPNLTQTVGSNVYLLKNGEVYPQGDMARHPRTMMGYTHDKKQIVMCVFDGRSSISAGGIYLEMADIMKYAGCYEAVNVDGGGSSTMYVNPLGIMNIPSDGTERSVSNGTYLVLSTPEDNEIAEIKFKDYSMKFPKYGVYSPKFYGYNKYGMLINSDLQGVTLSCPVELGVIEDGVRFVGNGDGTHALSASYNGITASIPVTVVASDNVGIRLKSIITDTFKEYPVEVEAQMNETKMPISPAALSWSSGDASIVTIGSTTGILKGVADGTTKVQGTLGSYSGELEVKVEKPTAHAEAIDKNFDASTWKISQTGGKNITATPLDNGMKLTYTGSSGRGPNIKLSKELRLWSLPDIIRIRINPGNAPINKITMSTRANTGSVVNTIVSTSLQANEMNIVDLPTSSWCNANDMDNYPLYVNYIQFDMGTSTTGTEYTIEIPGLEAIYNAIPESGSVGEIENDKSSDMIKLIGNNIEFASEATEATVYDTAGRMIISLSNVSSIKAPVESGVYIVKAIINGEESVKKIVK